MELRRNATLVGLFLLGLARLDTWISVSVPGDAPRSLFHQLRVCLSRHQPPLLGILLLVLTESDGVVQVALVRLLSSELVLGNLLRRRRMTIQK